jgi:exosortase E/protease (VPEID-CTERM system)
MSLSLEPALAAPVPAGAPALLRPARVAALVGLLLAEVAALTSCFDAEPLAHAGAAWARALTQARHLPQVALVAAGALVLFGGRRLVRDCRDLARNRRAWPAWPFLLAHLGALAGFVRLSTFVLGGSVLASQWALAWALAWLALAGLTLTLWLAAVLPPNLWPTLLHRAAVPLLGAALVGALAWGAGQLTDLLWAPLSRWTFWVVRGLLALLVRQPVCDPERCLIGTADFRVHIAPECSGYEGIGLIWVFLGVYLWLYRKELRFPAALLLLPLATAVIWLVNAVRITALIAVGTWGSPTVALGGFHSQAGWLAFNAVALGTVALSRRLRFLDAAEAESTCEVQRQTNPAAAFLAPLLVLVATMMLTTAFAGTIDWGYPLRIVTTGAVLWSFRRQYTGLFRLPSIWAWFIGGAVFVLWLALEPAASQAQTERLASTLAGVPAKWVSAWLVFRVLGSVVIIPLAEELAFRGYLPRRLQSADFTQVPLGRFTWTSLVLSSLLFGLLHGRWLAGTLAGMAYALALRRRGNLSDAVLAHAVTNALLAAYVLATGAWSMWT